MSVAERAVKIWPHVLNYVKSFEGKPKSQVPKIASFSSLKDATQDPLTITKLQVFISVAKLLQPYLKMFQTEKSMLPFMAVDLEQLLRNLMLRFIKKSVIDEATSVTKLTGIIIEDSQNHLAAKHVEIGLGAKNAIRQAEVNKSVSSSQIQELRQQCITFLSKLIGKLLEGSPLKYVIVRSLLSLNPCYIANSPENAVARFGLILDKLDFSNWLTADEGDEVLTQYKVFLQEIKLHHLEDFKSYSSTNDRLDVFFNSVLGCKPKLSKLWMVIRKLLILSHGQAAIERGYSVNKDVISTNMLESTIVSQRLVYHSISALTDEDISQLAITKDLLASCRSARMKY